MRRYKFAHKHWNYFEGNGGDYKSVSRKTKKSVKREMDEIAQEWDDYMDSEDYRFMQLPDCPWCGGGGVYRDHPFDTGYSCPDCYGSGKAGWDFDENRNKVIREANTHE
ncbi:hypothetical protein [Paenibacillus sp. SN-8-1]|uniref:hypothetical protein n=1 Tax=Paenibacillus sp. SN-8-1 TaxID=3435409 RepID=UPI003D9A1329